MLYGSYGAKPSDSYLMWNFSKNYEELKNLGIHLGQVLDGNC